MLCSLHRVSRFHQTSSPAQWERHMAYAISNDACLKRLSNHSLIDILLLPRVLIWPEIDSLSARYSSIWWSWVLSGGKPLIFPKTVVYSQHHASGSGLISSCHVSCHLIFSATDIDDPTFCNLEHGSVHHFSLHHLHCSRLHSLELLSSSSLW